jgi:hypothetical protein
MVGYCAGVSAIPLSRTRDSILGRSMSRASALAYLCCCLGHDESRSLGAPAPCAQAEHRAGVLRLSAAQRNYLEVFEDWLFNPSSHNRERRQTALELVLFEARVEPVGANKPRRYRALLKAVSTAA